MVHPAAHGEARGVAMGTGVVFILGIGILVMSITSYNSEALAVADKMNGFTLKSDLTMLKIFTWCSAIGISVMIAGLLGMFAIFHFERPNKPLISCYALTLAIAGGLMIAVVSFTSTRFQAIEHPFREKVYDFCNATTYDRLTKNLGCPGTAGKHGVPLVGATATNLTTRARRLYTADCGTFCQDRVDELKAAGGCEWLPQLCGHYKFKIAGTGYCLVTPANATVAGTRPVYYSSNNMTAEQCEFACNHDVTCTGYVTGNNECKITSMQATKYPTTGGWTAEASTLTSNVGAFTTDNTVGYTCNQKIRSLALERFRKYSIGLFWVALVFTVLLLVVGIATFCYLFTVSFRRKGKKGGGALCCLMNCPCLHDPDEDAMKEDEEEQRLYEDGYE